MEIQKLHINNEIEYSVRASQGAIQYGTGAMVDFKDQTLMTAAPSRWRSQIREVHDKRLQERLHVSFFGVPQNRIDSVTGELNGLSYVRFPEWYFCPSCGGFKTLADWKKKFDENPNKTEFEQKDTHMLKYIRCYDKEKNCHKRPLVASRFIVTCCDGHIDNFPWDAYLHFSNGEMPHLNPEFRIDMGSRSDSLEGIRIICETCHKSVTMSKILDPRTLESLISEVSDKFGKDIAKKYFGCTGRHPWKVEPQFTKQGCNKPIKVVIRGSSSVYFPVSVSSIVIPFYGDKTEALIKDNNLFANFETKIKELQYFNPTDDEMETLYNKKREELITIGLPESQLTPSIIMNAVEKDIENKNIEIKATCEKIIKQYAKIISDSISKIDESQVLGILSKYVEELNSTKKTSYSSIDNDFKYKESEFKALNGEEKKFGISDGFERQQKPIHEYDTSLMPAVKSISLIKSLREVQALIGFSRQFPISFTDELYENTESSFKKDVPKLVKINEGQPWFPGYEIKGEGVFIELDAEKISEWEQQTIIKNRTSILNRNYVRSFTGKSRPDRHIKPGFILVHTLAHLLLIQMSFDCGYNVASLKERIYYGTNSDGKKRAGILIYTSSGDSEGSLGGLVRLGQPDIFPKIYQNAINKARSCSNDPVCNCSSGQGKESLNLSACHSCVLLPETCCEEFNIFLDRGMLIGTFEDNGDFGFFDSQYALCRKNDDNTSSESNKQVEQSSQEKEAYLVKFQHGTGLGSYSYEEIYTDEIDVESEEDKLFFSEVFKVINSNGDEYLGTEKPQIECSLFVGKDVYKDVIIWPNSGIAYFKSDIADKIDKANLNNNKFVCINSSYNVNALLEMIK